MLSTDVTASTLITVAACNLNQWAMDFDGNMERIYQSCIEAQTQHRAHYRLGPELEIPGYGCEDHFYEIDTIHHSWESLCTLIERGVTDQMICDFGMPVLNRSARYNCRILVYKRRILLIRPKVALADSGNYRESRWFTAYQPPATTSTTTATQFGNGNDETIVLPTMYQQRFQQQTAPFGIQSVQLICDNNITIGCESCEELWTPSATHISLSLQGIDIIGNGSGSHHELRKLDTRLSLAIEQATKKCGGVYCYSNQRGCDGGRLYYDGGAFIAVNGTLLAQASQFSLHDVEVISATIDIDEVRSYRAAIPSMGVQSANLFRDRTCSPYVSYSDGPVIQHDVPRSIVPSPICPPRRYSPEEECCYGPACWLWDYLRRSGANGFFLPLSGGADSAAVAAIVSVMCTIVYDEIQKHPRGGVADDCRRICHQTVSHAPGINESEVLWIPQSPQEIANYILHTTYMGTVNSSAITKSRAKRLSELIGSYHLSITIDGMVSAVLSVFIAAIQRTPRYMVQGGTYTEDLALQNIQARLRMVTAYLFAQLLPWARFGKGFLLVLGSANVDEGLRGYMTKYDCSSADLNPIGAICKGDLKKMLLWAATTYNNPVLAEISSAPPSAELRPILLNDDTESKHDTTGNTPSQNEHSQLDEDEMGMTYEELGHFGKLRKLSRCGPVSM
jgi:NAD+ synthase (glutamine-hydrolysing)